MDATTSCSLINNFVTTVILNLNLRVVINLLVYAGAMTLGASFVSKIVAFFAREVSSRIRYKWTGRYERRMEEIKELNNKIHDRLVEIKNAIETGRADKKAKGAKLRLLYCAARLKKYDKTISNDIDRLLGNISFKHNNTVEIKNVAQTKRLINRIRSKIDKLWFGIS